MASENRPGVIVTQALSETSALTASPALVPVVLAPCFQIIEALKTDGTLNPTAKHSEKYNQSPMTITQAEFPDPRSNIDEIEIYEKEVSVQMLKFSKLVKLQRGSNGTTGSAFLQRIKHIYRPAFIFNFAGSFTAPTAGTEVRLVMAIDAANPSDLTKDLIYKFDATTTTPAKVAEIINETYGDTIAIVVNTNEVAVFSPTYGPAGSVTVRGGSSAADFLSNELGSSNANKSKDHRVEGSGLFAQDDEDDDLVSPFIAYSRGIASVSNAASGGTYTEESSWPDWAGYYTNESVLIETYAPAITFGGSSPTIPLKAATKTTPGDYVVFDSIRTEVNEVILVEENRFKLGNINASKSTFSSATSELVTRIYDTLEFGLVTNQVSLSPKNAYFIAQNLVYGEIDPEGSEASLSTTVNSDYKAARYAYISSDVSSYGATEDMGGTTLKIQEVVDGVQSAIVTIQFQGPLTIAQVASAITNDETLNCVATVVGDYLVIRSSKKGSDQSLSIKSDGSANSILGFSTSAATSASGKDIEIAESASLTSSSLTTTGITGTSIAFDLTIKDSFGTHALAATLPGDSGGFATPAALAEHIATQFGGSSGDMQLYWEGIPVAIISSNTPDPVNSPAVGTISFTTIEGGFNSASDAVSISMPNPVTSLGFSNANADDDGLDKLNGATLKFKLDENPKEYEIKFDSNSAEAAVDLINVTFGGDVDIASISSSTSVITLKSASVGAPSNITINTAGNAYSIFNFSSSSADGSGRPNPDFYIDPITNAVILGPNQLRDDSTGIPYNPDSSFVDVYIEYKALRKDVTASANSPGIVTFGSLNELETSIGPVSTENPLGLAAYLAMVNSTTATISCLGIDETNDAAPLGTVNGYLRAIDLLESKEVYAIAPMTDDHYIQTLLSTHVKTMSQPEERGERILLLWKGTPDRAKNVSIEGGSGTGALTGSDNQLRTESNHASATIAAGITDLTSISVSDGLYVEITTVSLGTTNVFKYSISAVDSVNLTLRTSFSGSENADGFYTQSTFSGTASYSSISYSLKVRGDELLITGTTLTDITKVTETAAAQGSDFDHRRVFLVFGDSVDTVINSQSVNIPGYYISAGIAGMIGSQSPEQPFTNLVMTGFSKVYGTDDTYSENQLDVIADGGRYVLKNLGGGIAARHQRSTSNLTIESRELSITKAIDFLAKGLREINRVFIGKFVITPGFLDQLTMANEGYLRRVVQQGVVRTSNLTSLLQSETAPDTVLIEVEVQPAYPCNKIRITIVS